MLLVDDEEEFVGGRVVRQAKVLGGCIGVGGRIVARDIEVVLAKAVAIARREIKGHTIAEHVWIGLLRGEVDILGQRCRRRPLVEQSVTGNDVI